MRESTSSFAIRNFMQTFLALVDKVPQQATLAGIFLLMLILLSLLTPNFMTISNVFNVLRQASTLFMLACGQTLVVLVRGLDLSQGAVVGLVSVITASALMAFGPVLAIPVGLLTGTICGLVPGFIVTKGKVPAFAATLGMLFVVEGVTLIYTDGQPIFGLPDSGMFFFIGGGHLGAIPFPAILFVLVGIFFYLLLKLTRFGRYLYAIGGNEEASRLSGIQVQKWIILAYTVNGFLVGLGSIILTSRVNSGQPLIGGGYLMESIGAVVIGGTSLFGGRGGILQTALGVCFLAFMVNGLTILGMSTFVRQTLVGILIIVSVSLSVLRGR